MSHKETITKGKDLKEYRLKKDLVIPAGSVFRERHGETQYGADCYQNTFGLTHDTAGWITYGIDPQDTDIFEWFEEIHGAGNEDQ